jgi:hypothetical protein
MRSGVTLADLRKEVAIEAGFSTESGHIAHSKERLNQLINRTERWMALKDSWPSRSYEEEVTITADSSTGTLPTNLTFTQISDARVLYGTTWLPITHGITPDDRSIWNATQRALPIQKWELQPGTNTFEVWPIPPQAQTLRFTGQKTIGAMVADDDTCALDGDVIVLRVAAGILGRDRKEDAQIMLQLAQSLTNDILKLQGGVKQEPITLGRGGDRGPMPRAGIDFIPPGGAY